MPGNVGDHATSATLVLSAVAVTRAGGPGGTLTTVLGVAVVAVAGGEHRGVRAASFEEVA